MRPEPVFALNPAYSRSDSDTVLTVCDSCYKPLGYTNYARGTLQMSQNPVRHCQSCQMDICETCAALPPRCPVARCHASAMQLVQGVYLVSKYGTADYDSARCDACERIIGKFNDEHFQRGAVWHCDRNHDLCRSCMLQQQQGHAAPGVCPHHPGQRLSTGYGLPEETCFICSRPIQPGEKVNICPQHFWTARGNQDARAHPCCLQPQPRYQ